MRLFRKLSETMQRFPRILFAAGGTGGHVYPALAVADVIREMIPEAAIAFAGTQERMEWEAVPRAGYAIHPITVSGLQRKLTAKNLVFPFRLLKGFIQSLELVKGFDADVAVGTGGFVAGPVLLAASMQKRPILIQEQNAFAGMTNRLLARRADRIHIAFEAAKSAFPANKCILSGNPVRPELSSGDTSEAHHYFDIPEGAQVLLVFGGSLGAAALNRALERDHLSLLEDKNIYLIWQTGALYHDRLQDSVAVHPRLRLCKYLNRMDLAYALADLVLCRAGAITCSELAATGSAALLVPSPNVAEDHQTRNAQSLVEAGAAALLPESELEASLLSTLRSLLADAPRRAKMGAKARLLSRPEAAQDIAHDVLALAGWPTRGPEAHLVSNES